MCHEKKKGKRNMVEYYRGINAQHGAVYHLSQEEKKKENRLLQVMKKAFTFCLSVTFHNK